MKQLALALALLFQLPAPDSARTAAASDFEAAVPTDAFALVRCRSTNELVQLLDQGRAKVAPDARKVSPFDVLASLMDPVGWTPDYNQVDTAIPIGVAFSFEKNGPEPVLTWILPAKDSKLLLDSIVMPEGAGAKAAFGAYVACSIGGAPERAEKASRVASGGPAGLLTARVDLAAVMEKFRPMIDMALDQLDSMELSSEEDSKDPFGTTAMWEIYSEFARDFVDSVDMLDGAFDVQGAELVLALDLLNREDSALAKYAHKDKVDYRALAGCIDPAAPVQFLGSYDANGLTQQMLPAWQGAIDNLAQAADARFADLFRAYFGHMGSLSSKFGRVSAGSLDIDEHGLRAAFVNYADPAGLTQAILDMLKEPAFAKFGLTTEPVTKVEIAGVQATALSVRFDLRKLVESVGKEVDENAQSELAQAEQFLSVFLGKDGARTLLLPGNGSLGWLIGGEEAWQASTAKRLVAGGSVSGALARSAERIQGANPAMLYQVDVAALVEHFSRFMAAVELKDELPDLRAFLATVGTQPLPASVHWGVSSSKWKLGASIDHEGLLRLIRASTARNETSEAKEEKK